MAAYIYDHIPQNQGLSSKIELFVKIKHVPKLDYMSPSDPFVVFSMQDQRSKNWMQFAYTEIVWDNPNPVFVKPIVIDYMFEEVQLVRLDVYDADSHDLRNLSNHDFVGRYEFLVGDLVTAKGCKLSAQLVNKKKKRITDGRRKPTIISVRSEEVSTCRDEISIDFRGEKLPKMDWLTSIDGYLQLYRKSEDNSWMAVAETNTIKNNKNPRWQTLKVSSQRLCNGDEQRPLLIKLFDWNWNAEPDYVGEIETSLSELMTQPRFDLKKRKPRGLGKKNRGYINIDKISLRKRYSFLEYLAGGCNIELSVAIDFTASNGHPNDRNSLHYMGAGLNAYQQALQAVGAVLEPYDSDNMIPVYGFGGKDHRGVTQHCFPLNGNPSDPEVEGMNGVLQAYNQAIRNYNLSGPTLFSEIIDTCVTSSMGPQTDNEQHYSILMIVTDGVINDVQRTIDSIVNGSNWPLSIIIIGVGNADFTAMDVLDADDEPLVSSRGQQMKADIVQFVPFNKFKNSPYMLAKEVLEEVPEQLTGYFDRQNIAPLPPRRRDSRSMSSMASFQMAGEQYQTEEWRNAQVNQQQSETGYSPRRNPETHLPPGWTKQTDPNGSPFYVNHNDQTTHWTLPEHVRE